MTRLFCLVVVVAAGCGGSSSSSHDLGAQDLSVGEPSDFAFGGCAALSTYCTSTSNCPATASAAEGGYCAPDGGVSTQPGISVRSADCPSYERVSIAFAMTNNSYDYYFDASSGALVAVVTTGYQGIPTCLAGPSNFTLPTCSALVTVCD
ncbi:MAG TPA: hypothetical protein VGL86_21985 [Polyangia bacterium]|jgi:hypothetical protein